MYDDDDRHTKMTMMMEEKTCRMEWEVKEHWNEAREKGAQTMPNKRQTN